MDEAQVRAEERERAVRILAAMHPISAKAERNTCHWREREDKSEHRVCVPCTDGEYTYEPWPCEELREFVQEIGWTGDLESLAVTDSH